MLHLLGLLEPIPVSDVLGYSEGARALPLTKP